MSTASRSLNHLDPTRDSLLTRLKNWDDQESWSEFFNTYWQLIYGVARKAGLSDADAQEVVQETVVSVAKSMKDFKTGCEHGSFKAWLLTIVQRRIIDQFRRQSREPCKTLPYPSHETDRTGTVERIPDPNGPEIEAAWDREWQRNRIDKALVRLQQTVGVKQFQIFQLLVTREASPAKVAEILGVSTTLVYVTKHRLRRRFQQELDRIDRETP